MGVVQELKCPNCGGELTKIPGGYLCEYCDGRFTSEADQAGQKVYAEEKARMRIAEEKEERVRKQAEEEERIRLEQEAIDTKNNKRIHTESLIAGAAGLVAIVLFILGCIDQSMAPIRTIGWIVWAADFVFVIVMSVLAKKAGRKTKFGAAVLFIIIGFVLVIIFYPRGDKNKTTPNNTQSEVENAAANNADAEGVNASPYTDINDFYYSVDTNAMTIILNNFKAEARERDKDIVLASQYTLDGAVYNLTAIGDDACFMGESHIESVVIPEGVTYIGANTFNSTAGIKYIYLPSSLQSLDPYFFTYLDSGTVTFDYAGSEETFNAITNYGYPQTNTNFTFNFNCEPRGGLDEQNHPLSPDERSESEKMGGALGDAFNGFINGLNGDD